MIPVPGVVYMVFFRETFPDNILVPSRYWEMPGFGGHPIPKGLHILKFIVNPTKA